MSGRSQVKRAKRDARKQYRQAPARRNTALFTLVFILLALFLAACIGAGLGPYLFRSITH